MPTKLPGHILKLAVALLKHQAKLWFGEEAAGIAAETITEFGGDELRERIEALLTTSEGTKKLVEAAQRADAQFGKKCKDDTLRQAFNLKFGDLPAVQAALADLPQAMDEADVRDALAEALKRDVPNLTSEQVKLGAKLYTECLQIALIPLKDFTLPVIAQIVQSLREEQREGFESVTQTVVDIKQEILEAVREEAKRGKRAASHPRHWLRPTAPRPGKPIVGRLDELAVLNGMLIPGARTAITASVQGLPGVGKTVLAEHLAAQLDPEFAGGVILEHLGTTFRDPLLTNPILNRWGSYAFGGLPQEGAQFTPDEVRSLLTGHGPILVVLDDIWDLKAIQPLLEALPNLACLLTTTRSQRIARDLHGSIYPLEVLAPEDALTLLRARIRQSGEADKDLLNGLAEGLGYHGMALDIAGGSLDRLPHSEWGSAVNEMVRQVREGSGFGEIALPGDEETESRVEAALAFSYLDLSAEAQTRFRLFGAFAPDGDFRVEAVAGIWKCSVEVAAGQLAVFVERGLVTQHASANPGDRWQQHNLLRGYALALLRAAGEEGLGRALHAEIYNAIMGAADDQQVYYFMLPDYSQLRHAFEWAIGNNLDLAQNLVGNAANLQAAFYLVRDNYDWAWRLAEAAKESDDSTKARSIGALGNALARLANLPDEDRRARLLEALAAYDEALQFRRPDTAPLAFAMTQANLALLCVEFSKFPEENRKEQLGKAIKYAAIALSLFLQIGHAPYSQSAARQLRWISEQASELFAELWEEQELGEIPDWLAPHEDQQGLTTEQFIEMCLTAAREKRPEAAELFDAATKMAADPNAPPEAQALGKALQQIMTGSKIPDLTSLPPEWAELIRKGLEE